MRNLRIMGWVLCGVMAAGAAFGADWPQMGGPDRNNISSETGLAREWPSAGPKVLWTAPLGEGYGSPSVRDGEVYVLDREGEARDILRCYALDSGKELWNYAYDAPGNVSHGGSRTAPTVTETHVYTVGLFGDFLCADRKTHAPVWQRNILKENGMEVPGWGVSQAPLLYGDLVIVAPQAPEAYVAAYNKTTGEPVWKTPSLGALGYSTPALAKLCGVDQLLQVGASTKDGKTKGLTAGISPVDGKILWTYDGWQCGIPIPFPTALPGDRVFITGGYKAGSAMLQIAQTDGAWTATELWKSADMGSQIQQPLFFGDHLYLNSNSNEREDGMMCVALDGAMKWKTKNSWLTNTFERGPLLLADGLVFNLDGKKGTLHLVAPSPEAFQELGSVKILSGKEIWAPMALSNGKLLVRSQSEMKCLDVANP